MKPRTLSLESLEDRTLMTTASDIAWEPQPLSTENSAAVLPGSTAGAMKALDLVALDGSRIARGLQDGTVEIFDTTTGALIHRIPGLGVYVSDIALSPDGRYITIGTDGVRVFDAQTFSEVGRFSTQGFVYPVAFIGNEIFSGTWEDKVITVYNTETRTVRTIAGGSNQANFLTTLGNRLYAYDYRGTLKELHPQTGAVLRSVQTPGGIHLSSSPTSGIVALGSNTGNVVYFDANLQSLGATNPGIGHIEYIGFDASGTKLSARAPGTVAFLDLANVPSGGVAQEVGRVATSGAGPFESSLPMTRDGSAVFIRTAAEGVIAQRTPWADAVDAAIEDVAEDVQQALEMPEGLEALITEAVMSLDDETAWRSPETNEASVRPLPKGMHLDLRSAQGLVSGVQTTVLGTGPLTAHVYRGSEEIETLTIGADGAFSVEDEDGITDIVFSGVGICAGNIQIRSDEDAPSATGEALTPFTSKAYAIAAAPTVQIPTNVAYVAGTLNYSSVSSIGGQSRRYVMRDPSLYTMIRASVTQGSGTIWSVGTIKKDGTDHMGREYGSTSGFPDGYAQWHGDSTVLIAPGAPVPISFIVGASGSQGNIVVTTGDSPEALLPPATMNRQTVDATIVTTNDQHQAEGIFPALTEVRESSSPTFAHPGDIMNVQYHVRNEALAGGSVVMDVYAGWYGGEATRGTLQNSFSLAMGGGHTVRVSANVTAPSKPADATSDRPIISAVVRLPDGTTVEHAKLGKEPTGETRVITAREGGGVTIRYESRKYTTAEQQRIHELTDRALQELFDSPDKRLVAARNALGDDRIVELIARNSAEALALAERVEEERAAEEAVTLSTELLNAEILNELDGIGGDPTDNELIVIEPVEQSSFFNPAKNFLLSRLAASEIGILERTAVGRFFLGISQKAVEANSDAELEEIAREIQSVTGIPASKSAIFLRAATTPERRVDMLRQMFNPANPNMGDPTLKSAFNPDYCAEEAVTYVSASLLDTGTVRIRFNFASDDYLYHRGNVYLMNAQGNQISNTPLITGEFRNALFVDVPLSSIDKAIRDAYGVPFGSISAKFKVALWDHELELRGLGGENISKATVAINFSSTGGENIIPGNYSTLPNTSEFTRQREIENHALSVIKANFPLDRSYTWLNTLGSPYHLGEDSAAMDLNINTGGDNDEDLPIKVVAGGTIERIGLDFGSVRVKHVAELNGESRNWYTEYLHMRLVANGQFIEGKTVYETRDKNGAIIATLYEGQTLSTGETIGGICGRGIKNGVRDDHAFLAHLHMEAEDDEGNMIRFGNLLTDMGIQTYAEDDEAVPTDMRIGGRIHLSWNDSIDEWVQETYGLIFDQENASTGYGNVWVAMTSDLSEKKRVIWKSIKYADEPEEKLRWVSVENEKEEWKIENGLWFFATHS